MFEVLSPEFAAALDRPDLALGANLVVIGSSDAVGDSGPAQQGATEGFRGPLLLLAVMVAGLGAYTYFLRGHLA